MADPTNAELTSPGNNPDIFEYVRIVRSTGGRTISKPALTYWCPDCKAHRTHRMSTEEKGRCVTCGSTNFAPTGEGA